MDIQAFRYHWILFITESQVSDKTISLQCIHRRCDIIFIKFLDHANYANSSEREKCGWTQ